jgi:hypothetical protein
MPQLDPENPIHGNTTFTDVVSTTETLGTLIRRLQILVEDGVPLRTPVILGIDPATSDADTSCNAILHIQQAYYYEHDVIILGDVLENENA